MIAVDSSALIAIHFDEPEKQAIQDVIAGGERCFMSAVNAHERTSVLRMRRGSQAVAWLWQLLAEYEIEIVPFDEAQLRILRRRAKTHGRLAVSSTGRPKERAHWQGARTDASANHLASWRSASRDLLG
ncbi:MAG: hypothetical protein DLM68_19565 [Hyphomicrobiales bacterium]|nr:MAG: hypothetical protein DLM68_19565 [Hyphomicrobiales bacterium]